MLVLIVLPVYNEEKILRENAIKLYNFLKNNLSDDWQIVIADNGSTDNTKTIGEYLANTYAGKIIYFFTPQKGRGNALKKVWLNFTADLYTFMDSDLATDLSHFPEMVKELKNNNDIVIGSRLQRESNVERSLFRELTSRIFNFILKFILNFKIKDSQCGFKGATKKVINHIVPLVQNAHWFFDTEFLFLSQRNGYKIKELPVLWTESPNRTRKSKINVFEVSPDNIFKVSLDYLKEIWRLKKYDKNKTQ